MAFMMVPVHDASGGPLRSSLPHPPHRMAAIVNASRMGETGETYAVDAEGRMISKSRFADQVRRWACCLRKRRAAHRRPEVRDPGGAWERAGPGDAAEDLAPDLGRGRGRGGPGRRQRGRLPRLPRRPGRGGLALAARMGHRCRDRDRS